MSDARDRGARPVAGRALRLSRLASLAAITGVALAIGAWSFAAETPHLEHAPAYAFHARALGGETLDLAALAARGPVVLDFWATWCQPCTQALPELEGVRQRWQERGVTVIGISIDGPRNQSRVRPFAAKLGLHYPILFDADGSLQRGYQVTAVPTTVVIDTAGRIAYSSEGWWPGETKKVEKVLAGLLAGPPEPAQP